ncbi:MAG: hypothetical protein RL660_1994 [Bacteroidota bacterium]|jgi:hypothetical protein
MTSVPVRVLTQDLIDRNELCLQQLEVLAQCSWEQLTNAPKPGKWSAIECVQHLQLYAQYYMPLISAALNANNQWTSYDTIYRSSYWGDYIAKSMLPTLKGDLRKMKTPSAKRPHLSQASMQVIDDFRTELQNLKALCNNADNFNLNKKCIAIAIFPLIKISIGDALRFVIYHNQRHFAQAIAALG